MTPYDLQRKRSLRRLRTLLLSRSLWRKRLVFWLGAVAIGLIAAFFAGVADRAQQAFAAIVGHFSLAPLLISPAIFAGVAYLTRKYCPTAVGSGIPQAIAAHNMKSVIGRRYLLGPRIIAGKMALTALALLGGASVGREGPTVQVGAAIMLLCAKIAGVTRQRGVVLAGAAAGVAAAFNTPLAGIVFAIEEMARSFEHRNSGIVLMAIVLSGAASMSVLGNYNYFGDANEAFVIGRDWFPVLLIGVIGGVLGSLFAWAMVDGKRFFMRVNGTWFTRHPVWFAAGCGIVVAALGLLSHGMTYGTGYNVANDLLHEQASTSWSFTAAKFLATVVSNFSGITGGLFSPSLTVGAAMGSAMAPWFDATPAQDIVLLGMVAYFAGVTQAPITAFVIVLEITGKEVMPAPLIATAIVSTAIARVLCPVSLYHRLAKNFFEDALARDKAATEQPIAAA